MSGDIAMVTFPNPEKVSVSVFNLIQNKIDKKLPLLLYGLVKDCDRSYPQNSILKITMPGKNYDSQVEFGSFLSFNTKYSENMLELYFNRPDHFPQDERFVPFGLTGNGDYFLFFYENGKQDPEPKVYYWAHEYCDIDGGLVFLANSFVEFLDMLKPDGYYD